MKHSLFFAATLVAAAVATSCRHASVILPFEARGAAPAPTTWANVELGRVSGEDSPSPIEGAGVTLAEPLTDAVVSALKTRLRSTGRPRIQLDVVRLRWIFQRARVLPGPTDWGHGGTLGIAADFILRRAGKGRSVRLEHSVSVGSEYAGGDLPENVRRSLYARCVHDLLDRLFSSAEALAALIAIDPQTSPEVGPVSPEVADSALVDEPLGAFGPVLPVAPSREEVDATGRMLWPERESSIGLRSQIVVGETNGALVGIVGRELGERFGYRYGLGGGGFAFHDGFAFTAAGNLGFEVGWRWVDRDPMGYVRGPGRSLLIIPTAAAVYLSSSLLDATTVSAGVVLECSTPVAWHFGVDGALFLGTGFAHNPLIGDGVSNLGLLAFPSFDVYLETQSGNVSLGLALDQVTQGDFAEMLRSPRITLTWRWAMGRGTAYAKSNADFLGFSLVDDTQVLSGAPSAFPPVRVDPELGRREPSSF